MSKIPYFPFYVSDWLGSRKVLLMTDAQKGIYITLLAHQWSDPSGSIPTERAVLQKMLPGSRWSNIEYVLNECFIVEGLNGERARNERLNVEQSRALAKSLKAKESANYKWNKGKQDANAERTQSERNANQIQNQNHNQKESLEAGEVPERPSPKKSKKKSEMSDEEWLGMVKANPAYKHLDIELVQAKLIAWCSTKGKQPTRSRLLNWLNREEKPLSGGSNAGLQTSGIGRAGGRNFAEDRARQQRERDARILARGDPLPGGIHKQDAFRGGREIVDAEAIEVPEMETG